MGRRCWRFAGMVKKGKQYNGPELPVDAIAIFPSVVLTGANPK